MITVVTAQLEIADRIHIVLPPAESLPGDPAAEQTPAPPYPPDAFFREHGLDLRTYGTIDDIATVKRDLARALNLPAGVDQSLLRITYDNRTGSALVDGGIIGTIQLPTDPPRSAAFTFNENGAITINGRTIEREGIPEHLRFLTSGAAAILPPSASIEELRDLSRAHGGAIEITDLTGEGIRVFYVHSAGEALGAAHCALYVSAPAAGISGRNATVLQRLELPGDNIHGNRGGGFSLLGVQSGEGLPARRALLLYVPLADASGRGEWRFSILPGLAPGSEPLCQGNLTVVPQIRP